jgi:hypothetical protein
MLNGSHRRTVNPVTDTEPTDDELTAGGAA